jgi:hypothetical protein
MRNRVPKPKFQNALEVFLSQSDDEFRKEFRKEFHVTRPLFDFLCDELRSTIEAHRFVWFAFSFYR